MYERKDVIRIIFPTWRAVHPFWTSWNKSTAILSLSTLPVMEAIGHLLKQPSTGARLLVTLTSWIQTQQSIYGWQARDCALISMDFNNDLMNASRRHEKKPWFHLDEERNDDFVRTVILTHCILFVWCIFFYIHTSISKSFEFQVSFIFCREYMYIAGVSQTQYFFTCDFFWLLFFSI